MSVNPVNIRRLFLERQPSYSVSEAADLFAVTERELHGWIEAGELEGEQANDGMRLPWAELVSFAMGFWDQEEIEAALARRPGLRRRAGMARLRLGNRINPIHGHLKANPPSRESHPGIGSMRSPIA